MLDLNAVLVNRMLNGRIKDLAARRPAGSKEAHGQRVAGDLAKLQRAIGLYPMPTRSDLQATLKDTVRDTAFKIETVSFRLWEEEITTADVYAPTDSMQHPSVVYAPDAGWSRRSPWVQSAGIGLALLGYTCVILDAPSRNEALPYQSLGYTDVGKYVWSIIRALDYCESRTDTHLLKCGIAGCGFGGYAALFAAVLDPRASCAAVSGCNASLELLPQVPQELAGLSGLLNIGDVADICALRAPLPFLLMGGMNDAGSPVPAQNRTREKLRQLYRPFKAEDLLKSETFVSGRDFNRRMREAMYAFFGEHLKLLPAKPYVPEARPLTDGLENPYVAGTRENWDQETDSSTADLRSSVLHILDSPFPEQVDFKGRLVGWNHYGKLQTAQGADVLVMSDEVRSGTLTIPFEDVDQSLATSLGLSVPEIFAQLLHEALPGGEEGWEQTALAAHALTSVLASVKTLVAGNNPDVVLKRVEASGPRSSLTAMFLHLYRPSLQIKVSHPATGWKELVETGDPVLFMPGARYVAWPF